MKVGLPDFFHAFGANVGITTPHFEDVEVPPNTNRCIFSINTTGSVIAGFIFIDAHAYFNDDYLLVFIDDLGFELCRLYDIYYYNIRQPYVHLVYSLYYNTTAHKALFGITPGISFKKNFGMYYYNKHTSYTRNIKSRIFYNWIKPYSV